MKNNNTILRFLLIILRTNSHFLAKYKYYFLLILAKIAAMVTVWRQGIVENAGVLAPLSQPFPLRDISDGGSGSAADAFSGNPCPNPAVAFFDNICEAGMMCRTAENRVLEWRARVTVYKNSRKKWLLDVFAVLRWRF
jgi:hypothetical protein